MISLFLSPKGKGKTVCGELDWLCFAVLYDTRPTHISVCYCTNIFTCKLLIRERHLDIIKVNFLYINIISHDLNPPQTPPQIRPHPPHIPQRRQRAHIPIGPHDRERALLRVDAIRRIRMLQLRAVVEAHLGRVPHERRHVAPRERVGGQRVQDHELDRAWGKAREEG